MSNFLKTKSINISTKRQRNITDVYEWIDRTEKRKEIEEELERKTIREIEPDKIVSMYQLMTSNITTTITPKLRVLFEPLTGKEMWIRKEENMLIFTTDPYTNKISMKIDIESYTGENQDINENIDIFIQNQENENRIQPTNTINLEIKAQNQLPFLMYCMVCLNEKPCEFEYLQCMKCKTPICDRCYITNSFTKGIKHSRACIICRVKVNTWITDEITGEQTRRGTLLTKNILKDEEDSYYVIKSPFNYNVYQLEKQIEPNAPGIRLNPSF